MVQGLICGLTHASLYPKIQKIIGTNGAGTDLWANSSSLYSKIQKIIGTNGAGTDLWANSSQFIL